MPMLERIDRVDYRLVRTCNQALQWRGVHIFFSAISRMGDGPVWYLLMSALPVYALATQTSKGFYAGGSLMVAGLIGLMVYRFLKTRLARERPFISHQDINCQNVPLDRYSFPSGHTLHAVMFATIALAWFPALAGLLVPLTCLIAVSRLVLGLHYPTDVVVGALLGFGVAQYVLFLLPPMA